jgi:hypothetical protein
MIGDRKFIMTKLLFALALLPSIATAQSTGPYRGPIIDVHLHAHTDGSLAQPAPNPATGEMSPKTAAEHMTRSLAIMKERNVVLGIVSGSALADVEAWDAAAPDRIMKGISVDDPTHFIAPQDLDRLFREKDWMRLEKWQLSTQATLPPTRRSMHRAGHRSRQSPEFSDGRGEAGHLLRQRREVPRTHRRRNRAASPIKTRRSLKR